jgi:hypothetical protein
MKQSSCIEDMRQEEAIHFYLFKIEAHARLALPCCCCCFCYCALMRPLTGQREDAREVVA